LTVKQGTSRLGESKKDVANGGASNPHTSRFKGALLSLHEKEERQFGRWRFNP
jgi:hypothetical protein